MTATVFFAGSAELATVKVTFDVSGIATDPTAVSLIVTDPAAVQVTYTYGGGGTITRDGTGAYHLDVPSLIAGLWSYVWIGTGAASDIQPGTWTVRPVTLGRNYCSAEELKSRLGIKTTDDDFEVNLAVAGAATVINEFCGRFFWRDVGATRTYSPVSIYEQVIDDLVSVTSLATDQDGDGVYETAWSAPDYQLEVHDHRYNVTGTGEARPYTVVRALGTLSGKWFPFVWPWTHQDRVQVVGTWGWPAVPESVKLASLMLAADIFKTKDAPFGVQGFAEYGAVRVTPGSQVYGFLQSYVRGKTKVGV